jgi:hypothetical protein
MTDELATGAPGGGAPAGGGGAAPAAPSSPAPAAPVSTPTPATPTADAPVAPAPITRNPGESADEFMARYRQQAKPEGDEKPADPAKPAVDPAKPDPAAKVEEKPAEVKPGDEKPAEAPAPEAQSKLAETIFSNEKLTAALEEAGLKDEVADALRTAARGQQFLEMFTDVDSAKFALVQAEQFATADEAAANLTRGDVKSTRDFVQKVLMPMSFVLKEDGTPEMVQIDDGRGGKIEVPRTDGTVDTLLSNLGDLYLENKLYQANQMLEWVKNNPEDPRAEQLKDFAEERLAALDFIKNDEPQTAEEELTPKQKAEQARIDADKKALAEEKNRGATEAFDRAVDENVAASDKATDGKIDDFLAQTSLAPNSADSEQTAKSKEALRVSIRQQIRDGLYKTMKGDGLYKSEQAQAARRGIAGLKSLPRITERYIEKHIYKVAEPILTNFGHERVRQAQARATKIAAQQDASRVDARAGSAPAKPHVPQFDAVQTLRDYVKTFTTSNRREPTMDEKVAYVREQEKVFKAKHLASV